MGRALILMQKLDEESSTAKHQLGEEWCDYDSDGKPRKFIYLKNGSGGALSQYACQVRADDDETADPVTATLDADCLIAIVAFTSNYYGWYQSKGNVEADVVANASGAAIAVGDHLTMSNGLQTLSVDSSPYKNHAVAVDAATTTTTITITLLNE